MRSRQFDELMIVNPGSPVASSVVRLQAHPAHRATPVDTGEDSGLLSCADACTYRLECATRVRRYLLGAVGRLYEFER